MARLIYVMDPMCCWCWGFAPVVGALAEQAAAADVPLQLVVGGLRSERSVMADADRARLLDYWRAVQESTGQDFDLQGGLPEGLVYDTEPACRALVTARALAPAAVPRLLELIQRTFYVQGRDVTQACVLAELAEQAGIDRQAFATAFDSLEQRQATRQDFAWAQGLGIAGFPTLLAECDGQLALLTNGYQPLDRLAPLLARWLEHGARVG